MNKTEKTENQRIVKWNEERQLIKTLQDLDMVNEMSFIIEEVIEGITNTKSEIARESAIKLSKLIASGSLEYVLNEVAKQGIFDFCVPHKIIKPTQENRERFADALGDCKVFSAGAIRKAQYDPDIVMDEVLQEIESRIGSIQNGKFVKDKSPEAQEKWYKADFTKADLL